VADHYGNGSQGRIYRREDQEREVISGSTGRCCAVGGVGNTKHEQHERQLHGFGENCLSEEKWTSNELAGSGKVGGVGNADGTGQQQRIEATETSGYRNTADATGCDDIEWIYCKDGKHRPIKSGIFPLADGSTRTMVYRSHTIQSLAKLVENFESVTDGNNTQEARAMRLKGYGNAIQADLAIEFIKIFMSANEQNHGQL